MLTKGKNLKEESQFNGDLHFDTFNKKHSAGGQIEEGDSQQNPKTKTLDPYASNGDSANNNVLKKNANNDVFNKSAEKE